MGPWYGKEKFSSLTVATLGISTTIKRTTVREACMGGGQIFRNHGAYHGNMLPGGFRLLSMRKQMISTKFWRSNICVYIYTHTWIHTVYICIYIYSVCILYIYIHVFFIYTKAIALRSKVKQERYSCQLWCDCDCLIKAFHTKCNQNRIINEDFQILGGRGRGARLCKFYFILS